MGRRSEHVDGFCWLFHFLFSVVLLHHSRVGIQLLVSAGVVALLKHRRLSVVCLLPSMEDQSITVTAGPNKAASLERRDCATFGFGRHWRGVGEPQR